MRALQRSWQACGLGLKQAPAKSSLSEYRQKVDVSFFKDIFENDFALHANSRLTFKGNYIYAIDGDHLDLPASESVLAHDFRGAKFSKDQETYYPKLYTVQAVDLLSGEIRCFSHSNKNSEIDQARGLISCLERNSITIYDRLHLSFESAWLHEKQGSYYFMRVPAESKFINRGITDFLKSSYRSRWINLPVPQQMRQQWGFEPLRVRLIKVKNKKTKKDIVFMTNAPEGTIRNKEAGLFYLKRWGVETNFRTLTDTLKMNQWHSLRLNGILQEIYALLWFVNKVRRLAVTTESSKWLKHPYKKSNFKLLYTFMLEHFERLLDRHRKRWLLEMMDYLKNRSLESRAHLARSYPRQVKRHGKKYKNASRTALRASAAELG